MYYPHDRKLQTFLVALTAAAVLLAGTPLLAQGEAPAAVPSAQVEVAFGTGLDRANRSLESEAATFAADAFTAEAGQVYCLTRIRNLDVPATVTHVWYHEGKTMARVDLTIGSSDWRTWSSKRILPEWKGAWEVKVLDANGVVLGSGGFAVN
jgi:hypothetical protein